MHSRRFTKLPRGQELFRPSITALEARDLLSTAVFMVRPSFGTVTIAPSLDGGGNSIPFTEQGPGSLTTGYAGRMKTDLDLTKNTIQFFAAGTIIAARDSGSWEPDVNGEPGSSPANYGAESDFVGTNNIALRDMRVAFSSLVMPLTPMGNGLYTFTADEDVNFTQGNLDFDIQFIGSGRTSFTDSTSNDSAILGTLQVNPNGSKQLTVPVNGTIFAGVVEGFAIKIKFDGAIGGFAPADSGRGAHNPRAVAGIVNVLGTPRSLADAAPVSFTPDSRPSGINADVTTAADQETTTVTFAVQQARVVMHEVYSEFAPIFVDAMLV